MGHRDFFKLQVINTYLTIVPVGKHTEDIVWLNEQIHNDDGYTVMCTTFAFYHNHDNYKFDKTLMQLVPFFI